MAPRSNKDILTIVLLVSVQILQVLTSELWDKRENNLMDYDDNEIGLDRNENLIPKLMKKMYPVINNLVNAKSRPGYETTTTDGTCSCKLKFESIPLGRSYFPKYIQTGFCQTNSCKEHYECIERKYTVIVLKRKDSKITEDSLSLTLPRTLRNYWTTEHIPVTVACDCMRGFQMVYQNM